MRLLRSVSVVAGLVGVALVVRALLGERADPSSLDTWPPVPKKAPTG
jgi:hypothetical protein